MIPRLLENQIFNALERYQKAIIILGARQVGKTTLLKQIQSRVSHDGKRVLYLNCDTEEDRSVLDTTSRTRLAELIRDTHYILIDEAQQLENPGLTLKIIHDEFPKVKLLVTGSSSFELKNHLSDALTGRYLDFVLYPLSLEEILMDNSPPDARLVVRANSMLQTQLLYGGYPEVYGVATTSEKKVFLEKIIESYLFKDILAFQIVRRPQAIKDLTKALAYQIGSEINENELANRLKLDRKTVVSYLDILEQAFVILRLFPFSKNPRREIGRRYKVYFTDVGVRNALIGDFNPFDLRSDQGTLWENFLILERAKYNVNRAIAAEIHFWRSFSGAEVDYMERVTDQDAWRAFEMKLSERKLSRGAASFARDHNTPVELIHKGNYLGFISGKGEPHA